MNNTVIPHIMQDYKIVASIINCFYRKLYSDGDKDIQVAVEMKNKIAQKNKSLTKYWNKIDEYFKKIEAHDINDFSRLDLENVKNKITFGSYQIKNCFGYLSEHFDQKGSIKLNLKKKLYLHNNKINIAMRILNISFFQILDYNRNCSLCDAIHSNVVGYQKFSICGRCRQAFCSDSLSV